MQSETIGALAAALAKAQAEMKTAKKDSTNPFFKAKYADLPAVVAACRPALTANGLSVIQTSSINEGEMVLITTLAHSSGEWISGVWPIRPVKNDPQGLQSAVTYARRGAYAITGVVSDDASDDDGEAAQGRTTQSAAIHGSKTMNQDPDVEEGVKNWCAEQKTFLANCATIADIQDWEEMRADGLKRLKSKALPAWSDLMKAKEARIGNINLAPKP